MGKSKPAPLGAALITTKGSARPTMEATAVPPPAANAVPLSQAETMQLPVAELQDPVDKSKEAKVVAVRVAPAPRVKRDDELPVIVGPTKSMTVKIDEVTYKKLKMHGVDSGRSSQDIFVDALALYFKANKL
jgi:hypothetical protein